MAGPGQKGGLPGPAAVAGMRHHVACVLTWVCICPEEGGPLDDFDSFQEFLRLLTG